MKYSDVNERHIYNVNFDPSKQCEFDGLHLAVVLKKNVDEKTVIVAPLTRSQRGVVGTKYNLGKIPSLPENLREDDSYVVYNQVRTVNCRDRIRALKNNGSRIDSPISDQTFNKILSLCFNDLSASLSTEEKIKFYYHQFAEAAINEAINVAYNIKRILHGDEKDKEKLLESHVTKITELVQKHEDFHDFIGDEHRKNGILHIISKSLDKSIFRQISFEEKIG